MAKVTFGTIATCKVCYVIVKIFTANTIKFVTSVETEPHKYCKFENGKKAFIFDSKKEAEDICFGLNVNGYGAFVMEVPDYFDYDTFFNAKDTESEENGI